MFEVDPRGIGSGIVGLGRVDQPLALDGAAIGGGAFDATRKNGTWALMAPCQDVAAGRPQQAPDRATSQRARVVPGPLTTPPRRLGAQGAIAWPPWTLPRPANTASVAAQVAQRIEARSLYWRGWSIAQIAEELALPVSTLSSWKQRQRWDTASPRARAEECLWVRYQTLLAKEQKTGSDFKEIDLLGRQFVTFARIGKFSGEEATRPISTRRAARARAPPMRRRNRPKT
jgi:ribosome-binding protein aMBF1 (putative translation factor)